MKLLYFAWVKDRVGLAEETVVLPSSVKTVSQLLDWLASRGENYANALADADSIRIAVNQTYIQENQIVSNDDEVALFPPVTGG
jgi:molybdopterin synthase sulfur carrier subunit